MNEKNISKIVKIPVGTVNKPMKGNLKLKGKKDKIKERLAKLKTVGIKDKDKKKKKKINS
jgi:hypothetical protein